MHRKLEQQACDGHAIPRPPNSINKKHGNHNCFRICFCFRIRFYFWQRCIHCQKLQTHQVSFYLACQLWTRRILKQISAFCSIVWRTYLNEGWTFKTTLEHALTGILTVVEATTAANCGLSYDNSGCQHRLTVVRQSMAHVRSLHFTGFDTCCGLHKGQSMGCQLSGQCISPLSWHSFRLSQMGHWFASDLLPTVGLVAPTLRKVEFPTRPLLALPSNELVCMLEGVGRLKYL